MSACRRATRVLRALRGLLPVPTPWYQGTSSPFGTAGTSGNGVSNIGRYQPPTRKPPSHGFSSSSPNHSTRWYPLVPWYQHIYWYLGIKGFPRVYLREERKREGESSTSTRLPSERRLTTSRDEGWRRSTRLPRRRRHACRWKVVRRTRCRHLSRRRRTGSLRWVARRRRAYRPRRHPRSPR